MSKSKKVTEVQIAAQEKVIQLERSGEKIKLEDIIAPLTQDMELVRTEQITPKAGDVLMSGWNIVKNIIAEARKQEIDNQLLEIEKMLEGGSI